MSYTQYTTLNPSVSGALVGSNTSIYKNTLALAGGNVSSSSVWIYVLSNGSSTWTLQQTLNNSFMVGILFPSIYEDTIAIGSPNYSSGSGAVTIYTRSGTTWTLQQTITLPSDSAGSSAFGYYASLYRDTLAVGCLSATSAPIAWVYTRSGTTWSEQQKLSGTGGSISSSITAVSVYQDMLVIGASNDGTKGAVWTFTRNAAGVWSQVGSKLTPSDNVGNPLFGYDVSLYSTTVAIGGPSDSTSVGATWIYTYSGGVWTEQQKLVGSGSSGASQQGTYVSLYLNTVATSGYSDNSSVGATWVFTRSGSVWTQQGSKIIATGATGNSAQGVVALYNNNLCIGGPSSNTNFGIGWVFQYNSFGTTDFTTGSLNTVFPENHYTRHSTGGADILSLTNGKLFVGNASNQLGEVTMSGDATITNAGVLTLATTGVTAGTYAFGSYTLNAKGLVTNVDTYPMIASWSRNVTAGSISIPDQTATAVTATLFNTTLQTIGITFSGGINTINTTGIYLITMQGFINDNSPTTPNLGFRQLYVLINGTTKICYCTSGYSFFDPDQNGVALYSMTANDTIQMFGFQFDDAAHAKIIAANNGVISILSAYRSYPTIYCINTSTNATSVATGTTATQITNFNGTNSISSGISVSSGTVTIGVDGFYIITYQVPLQIKGSTMAVYVTVNGTITLITIRGNINTTASSNFIGYASAGAILHLFNGDTLQLYVAQNTGSSATLSTTIPTYFSVARLITNTYGIAFGTSTTAIGSGSTQSLPSTVFSTYYVGSGIYVSSASPFIFTINIPGTYAVWYQLPSNLLGGSGNNDFFGFIALNGTNGSGTRLGMLNIGPVGTITIGANTYGRVVNGFCVWQFAAGDQINLTYSNNSGAAGNIITTVNTYFCVFKID